MTKDQNQPAQPVSGAMTDAQIRQILVKYSKCIEPGLHSSTEFDCADDLLAFARDLLSRAQDAQVVRNAALEEVKQLCRKWSSTAWIIPEISALQSAPTQPVERPDAVELPPLPEPTVRDMNPLDPPTGYSERQMLDYALAAIAANQPQQVRGNAQEPVAIVNKWMGLLDVEMLKNVPEGTLLYTAAPQVAQEEGAPAVPDYRGYAHLGTGQYVIDHSAAGAPAELCISIATEEQKAGRKVGEDRDNPPGHLIQPDAMCVRIRFENVAGLDALESQLRYLRDVHFVAAPQSDAQQTEKGEQA